MDWNRDGQYDNLFVTYMHCSYFLVPEGAKVDANTAVALSGGSGGYAPHLHWEINTEADFSATGEGIVRVSLPAYPYYRGIRHWNGGRDLDFISDVRWTDNRILSAVVYANDEDGYHPVQAGSVNLFYRTEAGAAWQGPEAMDKAGDRFTFALSRLPLPGGGYLEFFLRARRDDLRPSYNYAFFPPKYYRPSQPDGRSDRYFAFFSILYN